MSIYDRETLAYLAGCLDSDGFFTIRRDTRSMKAAGRTPTHVAMVGLRQVTPQVPHLLQEVFSGHIGITKSTAPRGRDLIGWHVTAKQGLVDGDVVPDDVPEFMVKRMPSIRLEQGGRARFELTVREVS